MNSTPTGSGISALEPVSLPELAYRQLRSAIMNGAYPPGSSLRQDEVAAKLGVSRNPLREALPRLESEGIVVLSPRRGYAVATLAPHEIEEVFALRILLETELVQRAARLRTESDSDRIRRTMERMDLLAPQPGPAARAEWFDANLQLHDLLVQPANWPHHTRALRQSRALLEIYIRAEAAFTGDLEQAQREHAEIAAAYFDGDAARLTSLVRAHSEHTRDRLLRGLAQLQPSIG